MSGVAFKRQVCRRKHHFNEWSERFALVSDDFNIVFYEIGVIRPADDDFVIHVQRVTAT